MSPSGTMSTIGKPALVGDESAGSPSGLSVVSPMIHKGKHAIVRERESREREKTR
ncbi:hypothetical protein L209DRAFT_755713 [Thermothelomyces heterothallicus CBS 203.75]